MERPPFLELPEPMFGGQCAHELAELTSRSLIFLPWYLLSSFVFLASIPRSSEAELLGAGVACNIGKIGDWLSLLYYCSTVVL